MVSYYEVFYILYEFYYVADESISSDSIKNAFKLFQKWEILECHNQNKLRLYYLKETHDDDQSVRDLRNKIDKYRYGFQV